MIQMFTITKTYGLNKLAENSSTRCDNTKKLLRNTPTQLDT